MKYFVGVFLLLSIVGTLSKAKNANPFLNFPRIIRNDKSDSRIVDGLNATDTQFPYQVYIRAYEVATQTDPSFACGGIIIALNWVLTAAHCVVLDENSVTGIVFNILGKYNLIAGSLDRGVVGANGQSRDVLGLNVLGLTGNAKYHPQYDPNTIDYDIGLLRVTPAFIRTIYVAPVALPPSDFDLSSHNGDVATASGFGRIVTDGDVSDVLLWTNLIIRIPCFSFPIPSTAFCAQSEGVTPFTAICQGDSGGPLTIVYNGVTVVVGIVSFTIGSCGPDPQGFTNVAQFRDYIINTMNSIL